MEQTSSCHSREEGGTGWKKGKGLAKEHIYKTQRQKTGGHGQREGRAGTGKRFSQGVEEWGHQ